MLYWNRIKSELILLESDITNRSAIVYSRVDNGPFAMTDKSYDPQSTTYVTREETCYPGH